MIIGAIINLPLLGLDVLLTHAKTCVINMDKLFGSKTRKNLVVEILRIYYPIYNIYVYIYVWDNDRGTRHL